MLARFIYMLVCIDLFSYFNTLKREKFLSPPSKNVAPLPENFWRHHCLDSAIQAKFYHWFEIQSEKYGSHKYWKYSAFLNLRNAYKISQFYMAFQFVCMFHEKQKYFY